MGADAANRARALPVERLLHRVPDFRSSPLRQTGRMGIASLDPSYKSTPAQALTVRATGVSGLAGESNRGQGPLLRPCFLEP